MGAADEPPPPVVRLVGSSRPDPAPAATPAPGPRRAGRALAALGLVAAVAVVAVAVHGGTAPSAAPRPSAGPSPRPSLPAPQLVAPRLYVPSCDPAAVYRLEQDGTPVRLTGTVGRGTTADGHPVAAGRTDCPDGLAFDDTGVQHVVGPSADRVRVVTDGGHVTDLDGATVDPRTALGLRAVLISPDAVAVDAQGLVYVGSPDSTRVRRTDTAGVLGPLTPAAADPYGAYDPAVSDPARPAVMAVAPDLSVYFADGGTGAVYRVDARGRTTTVAGTGTSGSGGDGGPATAAHLDDPRSVALDRAGRLYVSEGAGRRVRVVDPDGTIRTLAGGGVADHSAGAGYDGDGGPASGASFTDPGDLALDDAGDLYVVDLAAGAVRLIGPDGTIGTLGG